MSTYYDLCMVCALNVYTECQCPDPEPGLDYYPCSYCGDDECDGVGCPGDDHGPWTTDEYEALDGDDPTFQRIKRNTWYE